jgi:hypothetical protein
MLYVLLTIQNMRACVLIFTSSQRSSNVTFLKHLVEYSTRCNSYTNICNPGIKQAFDPVSCTSLQARYMRPFTRIQFIIISKPHLACNSRNINYMLTSGYIHAFSDKITEPTLCADRTLQLTAH